MEDITITKELFLDVIRCSKAAYLRVNNPSFVTEAWYLPLPEQREDVFNMVCKQIRPNAFNIMKNMEGWNSLAQKTIAKLNSKNSGLQNAVFLSNDNELAIIPIMDVGEKLTAWLVKDTAGRLYEQDMWGAAYDLYVMRKCGLKVDNLLITLLNPHFLKDGDKNLFEVQAVTDKCLKVQHMVEDYLKVLKKILRYDAPPQAAISYDCQQPNECVFKKHCWEHIKPGNVFELTDISFPQKFRLYTKGSIYLNQLRPNIKLSNVEKIQVKYTVDKKEFVDATALKSFFEKIKYGFVVRYLDLLSTISPAPLFENVPPFSTMAFHATVLGAESISPWQGHLTLNIKGKYDVRKEFAEWLVKTLHPHDETSIIVWDSQPVKARLGEFCSWYPELKEDIIRIKERLIDLSSVFKMKAYYHPSFYGRHDLSAVSSALFNKKEFILEGVYTKRQARKAFYRIKNSTASERLTAKQQLTIYSSHNTIMMQRIHDFLKSKINNI